ncbi:hypothetical protein [Rhizobium sp. CG5]|uniref:hypothetical protein n=1 Tax=Rhizobium sp. CG5 TaxID=2726076 RepID=UPI00203458A5|nr:hypothetical protein [Rhizobium sp. CG5]
MTTPNGSDQQTSRPANTDVHEQPLPATDARQGFPGRPVLVVLLAGLLLAMVVWIPVEWWGNGMAPEQPGSEQVTPAPSPADNTNGNNGGQPNSNP